MPTRKVTVPGVSSYQTNDGTRWYWVADGPPGPNGERRQVRRRGYATEAAAGKAKLAYLDERAVARDPTRLTLAAYLTDEWLPHYRRTKPRSYRMRETAVRRHIVPAIGRTKLADLTARDLNRFYAALQDAGYAANTVRTVHAALSLALEAAVDWDLLARNPARKAEPPGKPTTVRPTLTPAQIARLVARETDTRYRALWALLALTGMRRAELLALRWDQVDLARGVVTVAGTTKTQAGRRSILIGPKGVAILREHQRHQDARRETLGADWEEHGLVFDQGTGRRVANSVYANAWARALQLAGLPHVRPHDVRHSNATIGLGLGTHPKIMQERLGHSAVGITLDLYSHSNIAFQEGFASAVEDAIWPDPPPDQGENRPVSDAS